MWIIPPLPPGSSRADRMWHRRETAATERELKNVWTNACLVTRLAQVIPPPGAIIQTPVIGAITLDSAPAHFTVKLRAGQLPIDFARRAERFASAFRVPAVEIVPLTRDNQWISVRLMEPCWIEWPDEYVLEPSSIDEQPAMSGTVTEPNDHALPVGSENLRHGRHRANQLAGATEPSRDTEPVAARGSVLRFLGDFWRLREPEPRGNLRAEAR